MQDFVVSYDESIHKAHGCRPVDVTEDNSLEVYNRIRKVAKHRKPRYAVGDAVRIAKNKRQFEKGFEYMFHEEMCFVTKVVPHELRDAQKQPIKGKFYEQKLPVVQNAAEKEFNTERISKKRKGKIFLWWLGYGPEHNS